ncbi:MAG: hypothetical protein WCX95_03085 [Candidatus Gracilibacteria bacterium]
MKTPSLRKALAILVLTALSSTFLGTNVVFGAPTQAPSDAVYVSPTFKNVDVKGGAFTFAANTLTGSVTSGITGSVAFNGTNTPGVAIKGNIYTDQLISLKNIFSVGFMIAIKSILTLKNLFALGNIYAGGEIWTKGAGTFANVNTAIIQNLNDNDAPPTSDPVVVMDDLKIVAGVAGSGNTGKLIVTGDVVANANAIVSGDVNAVGDVTAGGNLGVSGTTRLNNLYVTGRFGGGLVNRASEKTTIKFTELGTATVACDNSQQFMTHCGALLQQMNNAGVFSFDNGFLHVVDTNVVRNASGVDTCTVKAYNNGVSGARYLTAKASCLDMREPVAGGVHVGGLPGVGGFEINPPLGLDFSDFSYNFEWQLDDQHLADFTLLDVTPSLEAVELQLDVVENPLLIPPTDGITDPVESDMAAGLREMMQSGMF